MYYCRRVAEANVEESSMQLNVICNHVRGSMKLES